MPSESESTSSVPKRKRRWHNTRSWRDTPEVVTRSSQVYRLWQEGYTWVEIGLQLGISYTTVHRDLDRARTLARERASIDIEAARADALARRQRILQDALEDRERADPGDAKGRALLLRTIAENQQAIEELQWLRGKDALAVAEAKVVLVQIGAGSARPLEQLSNEELTLLQAHLSGGSLALSASPENAAAVTPARAG